MNKDNTNKKNDWFFFNEEDLKQFWSNLTDKESDIDIDKIVIEDKDQVKKFLYEGWNYYRISLFWLIKEKIRHSYLFMKSYYQENKVLSFILVFFISILIVWYIWLLILNHLFTI